jgi:hypothetical protein
MVYGRKGMTDTKTHYRKAFNSPYLSSADIVGPTVLHIRSVVLERDKTKKTKDSFNTAYFDEKEIRPGEPLKPMILNAHNSRVMRDLCGSHFIDDWSGAVTVYVDDQVRFGRETVEGLRLNPGPVYISDEQSNELDAIIRDNEIEESDVAALLTWAKCNSLTEIQATQFRDVKSALMRKVKAA